MADVKRYAMLYTPQCINNTAKEMHHGRTCIYQHNTIKKKGTCMHTQLILQLPGKTHNNTKDNVATIHNKLLTQRDTA